MWYFEKQHAVNHLLVGQVWMSYTYYCIAIFVCASQMSAFSLLHSIWVFAISKQSWFLFFRNKALSFELCVFMIVLKYTCGWMSNVQVNLGTNFLSWLLCKKLFHWALLIRNLYGIFGVKQCQIMQQTQLIQVNTVTISKQWTFHQITPQYLQKWTHCSILDICEARTCT